MLKADLRHNTFVKPHSVYLASMRFVVGASRDAHAPDRYCFQVLLQSCVCFSLTSINIPDTVTSIGSSAFRGCESLTSINIPDSVTSIGDSAFSWCESLTNINIPDSVTSIGESAFCGCKNLNPQIKNDIIKRFGTRIFSII